MFNEKLTAACGAYCGDCEWAEKMNCPGCQAVKGDVFWGECKVAKCATDKNIIHCGFCNDLPCEVLLRFFSNPEHGDNGERLDTRAGTGILTKHFVNRTGTLLLMQSIGSNSIIPLRNSSGLQKIIVLYFQLKIAIVHKIRFSLNRKNS